jgi:hypothetical protein
MALFASINIVRCPKCGAPVVARGIYVSKAEPELNVAKCAKCGIELQVSEDRMSGKTRVESVKRN